MLNDLASKKYTYTIVGDFNIDVLKMNKSKPIERFIDKTYSSGSFMIINKPTHVPLHTDRCCCGLKKTNKKRNRRCNLGGPSILDHIYTNSIDSFKICGIHVNDITDHYPVFFIILLNPKRYDNCEQLLIRDFKCFNTEQFNTDLNIANDLIFATKITIHQKFEILQNIIKNTVDKNAPLRSLTKKERKIRNKPWISRAILNSIKHKNDLFYKIKKRGKIELTHLYKKYSNKLNHTIHAAKKSHYNNLFDNFKTDSKRTWQTINNIINKRKSKLTLIKKLINENGNYITDKKLICILLNQHFIENGPKLAKKIPNNQIPFQTYMGNPITNSIFISPTNSSEVSTLIKKMKHGKASGLDGISSYFIKKGLPVLSNVLAELINEAIFKGVYPNCLKIALVVPIFKKGSKENTNNYRPISLISNLSKIFEKVLYVRLVKFLRKNNIYTNAQFGFRSKHSTQHALAYITDHLHENVDNSKCNIAVYLDLAKAFETVNHEILLQKLYHNGIRGIALDLFKSYLSNRMQCVKCNGVTSTLLKLICGVPQGSTLGPLLFLLYINDLPTHTTFKINLFADDTCLISSSQNFNNLEHETNQKLEFINNWFISNKLTINYKKTKYMTIYGKKNQKFTVQLKMGDIVLERVKNIKYLGLIMDENLVWKNHIQFLKTKLTSSCNIMYKLRYYVPLKSRISIYYSLFYSYLQYGIICWGSTFKSIWKPLLTLQKKIIKAMLFKPLHTSCEPLFLELNLLKLPDVYRLELAKHVHKHNSNSLPSAFQNQYVQVNTTHDHSTRSAVQNNLIKLRYKKSTAGQRTTTYNGSLIWNSIPNDIKTSKLKPFIIKYKNFMLAKYCSNVYNM